MYFLNINKPKNMSSFDVIRCLRKKLKIKQIGHSGTLDPMAGGVLQIGVGQASKLLNYLDSDKTYTTKIKFGYVSDTFDLEGNISFYNKPDFTKNELINTLNSFLGTQEQIPPKYSAIKQNGYKLCDLMRQGKENDIKLSPRIIEIYSINLIDFNNYDEAVIEVRCKKGTYIRSLVSDIGYKLNCGAYILELDRIKAGNFDIKNSNNLDDNEYNIINPLDAINLPKIEISNDELSLIFNGNFIENKSNFSSGTILLTNNKKLVSLAQISDNLIKPKKNFKG